MKTNHSGSTPFRVALFFAANPEETLLTPDLVVKFDINPNHVSQIMKRSVADGWLVREVQNEQRTNARRGPAPDRWKAGPQLLRTIGRAA